MDDRVGKGAQVVEDVLGVAPLEHAVEEPAVVQPVRTPGRVVGHLGVVGGMDVGEVEDDAQPVAGVARPHRRDRVAVGQQQVVCRGHRGGRVGDPGRVHAGRVAQVRRAPRLVERRPPAHAVAERVVDHGRVVHEALHGVAVGPAAGVLQGLGEVPVVERDEGLDAGLQQAVDQPPVEVQAELVHGAGALGQHAWPCDREPVGAEAEVGQQRDVVLEAEVVVRGGCARLSARDAPRLGCEGVPDGRPPAVGVDRALDLVGRRGRTPEEPLGEAQLLACHAFTAPSMIPATSWRPTRMNTSSSGTVPSTVPFITRP